MSKTVDIFYKSYKKDFWLLQLSLKSLSKNVTGYNTIVLLIPEDEKEFFDTRNMPERTLIHYVKYLAPGWLAQQAFKIKAHEYCYADYIMFADSDCIYTYPINLQDFIKDDKPEILYTDWVKVGDGNVWREPTERILGEQVDWEFMRRNCLIYHRETLIKLNSEFRDLHETGCYLKL